MLSSETIKMPMMSKSSSSISSDINYDKTMKLGATPESTWHSSNDNEVLSQLLSPALFTSARKHGKPQLIQPLIPILNELEHQVYLNIKLLNEYFLKIGSWYPCDFHE